MPSNKELFGSTVLSLYDKHTHREKYKSWKWPIPELQSVFHGIYPGLNIIIAGTAKAGKTAFMVSLNEALETQGARTAYFTMEENDEQIMIRKIAHHTGISRNKFRDLELDDDDWAKLQDASQDFSEQRGDINYGMSTVKSILLELARMWKDGPVDIVFIDQLTLMSPDKASPSRTQEISEISRAVKAITLLKEINVPGMGIVPIERAITVIIAVQLNDDGNFLWSRDPGRDGDIALKMYEYVDMNGVTSPNKRVMEVTLSRISEGGAKFTVYFNGALSLVGGDVDVLKKTDLKTYSPRDMVRRSGNKSDQSKGRTVSSGAKRSAATQTQS